MRHNLSINNTKIETASDTFSLLCVFMWISIERATTFSMDISVLLTKDNAAINPGITPPILPTLQHSFWGIGHSASGSHSGSRSKNLRMKTSRYISLFSAGGGVFIKPTKDCAQSWFSVPFFPKHLNKTLAQYICNVTSPACKP